MENIISTLITDRTPADVGNITALKTLGWSGMTAAQQAQFLSGMKGAYNASDLNRVGQAVAYLASVLSDAPQSLKDYAESKGVAWSALFELPYDPSDISVSPKTDWTYSDQPTAEQLATYLANVVNLRNLLTYDTDVLPTVINTLTTQQANAIEKALVGLETALNELVENIETLIDTTAAAWYFSGEVYTGEVQG